MERAPLADFPITCAGKPDEIIEVHGRPPATPVTRTQEQHRVLSNVGGFPKTRSESPYAALVVAARPPPQLSRHL